MSIHDFVAVDTEQMHGLISKAMKLFLLARDPLFINIFKAHFRDLYFLNDLEDISFRLPDFGADLVLVNEDIILKNENCFERIKEVSTQIPVRAIVSQEREEEIEGLGWERPFLAKPLSFETLKVDVEAFFTQL